MSCDAVATREGGVDRNLYQAIANNYLVTVATREGGVDRNFSQAITTAEATLSPPARVAWIEI